MANSEVFRLLCDNTKIRKLTDWREAPNTPSNVRPERWGHWDERERKAA